VETGEEITSSKDVQHNMRYGDRPAVFAEMAQAVADRLLA
jgi:hypothetical protein